MPLNRTHTNVTKVTKQISNGFRWVKLDLLDGRVIIVLQIRFVPESLMVRVISCQDTESTWHFVSQIFALLFFSCHCTHSNVGATESQALNFAK